MAKVSTQEKFRRLAKVQMIGKTLKPCASRYFRCREAEGVPMSTSNRFLVTATWSTLRLIPDVIVKAKSTLSQTKWTIAAIAIRCSTYRNLESKYLNIGLT